MSFDKHQQHEHVMHSLKQRLMTLGQLQRTAEPVFISDVQKVSQLIERLKQTPLIGLDTEFVRETTFVPELALLQLSLPGDSQQYLIDVPGALNIGAMLAALVQTNSIKIMHGCSEDLEILLHQQGDFPEHIFDTQVAASLLGAQIQSGYNTLVCTLFDVEVDKTQTRSDWFKRPLSANQMGYAATDVLFLLPLYAVLNEALIEANRRHWLDDELSQLKYSISHPVKPELYYQKITNHWRLPSRSLYLLQQLCIWRESKAREHNLPRGFVLSDNALGDIVRYPCLKAQSLKRIKTIKSSQWQTHGESLMQTLERIKNTIPEDAGKQLPTKRPVSKVYRPVIKALKAVATQRAHALAIDPSLLLGKRYLLQFFDYAKEQYLCGAPLSLDHWTEQPWMQGWRRTQILEYLIDPFLQAIAEVES